MHIIIGIGGTQTKCYVGGLVQTPNVSKTLITHIKAPCVILQKSPCNTTSRYYALLVLHKKCAGIKKIVQKFKRRTTYSRRLGYRTPFVVYRVLGIIKEENSHGT